MTFRVGQAVECIDGNFNYFVDIKLEFLPAKGGTYTIRDIVEGNNGMGSVRSLVFEEFRNRKHPITSNEYSFCFWRFRPVVEPKPEVSFTTSADPSTDQFDNRRKVRKKVAI